MKPLGVSVQRNHHGIIISSSPLRVLCLAFRGFCSALQRQVFLELLVVLFKEDAGDNQEIS